MKELQLQIEGAIVTPPCSGRWRSIISIWTRDALPDGDHHKMVMVVRDEAGDLVFRASIVFNVEAEGSQLSSRSLPDSHA
ncbi:DUF6894 family protein [Mesorhizobium sp. Cs1299R1N3]|uniref:DUF6894 family protein n=1 Tax=unclassified Mesorhizobium TaxID=325217 RepID=UPI003FA58DDE